jgi:hypothetical protein
MLRLAIAVCALFVTASFGLAAVKTGIVTAKTKDSLSIKTHNGMEVSFFVLQGIREKVPKGSPNYNYWNLPLCKVETGMTVYVDYLRKREGLLCIGLREAKIKGGKTKN